MTSSRALTYLFTRNLLWNCTQYFYSKSLFAFILDTFKNESTKFKNFQTFFNCKFWKKIQLKLCLIVFVLKMNLRMKYLDSLQNSMFNSLMILD